MNSCLLSWIKAAKDAILAANAFFRVFSFLNSKGVSLSISYQMIRCILFAKSKQGTHSIESTRVPEIASSGTYMLHKKSSILFFQSNRIIH